MTSDQLTKALVREIKWTDRCIIALLWVIGLLHVGIVVLVFRLLGVIND